MAAADLLTLLPPQQTFVDDLDMDSFFDFDQDQNQNQNQNQSQTINAFGQPNLTITTDPFSQGLDDAQIFAGPSHQYDQFRQQTGVPTGNLSQLQEQITPNTSYGYFDPGVDPTWQQPMLDNETMMQLNPAMPMQHIPSVDMPMLADPLDQNVLESIEEEPVSSVGRLWPGMHQQQAAQAAHAKALALASANVLRTPQSAGGLGPTTTSKHSHARAGSIAPSANEDDFASSAYMQSSARVKKEDDDFDDDERLLNSEEGKKLTSKERRQLRNKVSARAFRSRRKEYIQQLEGELNVKAQECNALKARNASLNEENSRNATLIQYLIRQPALAPFFAGMTNDPIMASLQGIASRPTQQHSSASMQQPVAAQSFDAPKPEVLSDRTRGSAPGPSSNMPFDFRP